MAPVQVSPALASDAGELLTLQRAAFVTEAQLYRDPWLPALVETLAELTASLAAGPALKATAGGRVIGSVRGRVTGDQLAVGRLVVAPDQQGRGVGTALLRAVEAAAGPQVRTATLFTGARSEGNLRLYRRLGYREQRRERVTGDLSLVHLAKPLPG